MNKRVVGLSAVLAVAVVATVFIVRSGKDGLPSADEMKVPSHQLTGAIGGAPIGGGKLSPAYAQVTLTAMPVQWVAPLQSAVSVNVQPASSVTDPVGVELYLDGQMIHGETVPARTSKIVGTVVKSDGQSHELWVKAYKNVLDGPRVLAAEKRFPIELPAQ